MVLGVDFDNTIVCYDDLFHKIALERNLIPLTVPPLKSEVRDYLRREDLEDEWTALQGLVYGTRIREAVPYAGVLDAFERLLGLGREIRIISHKTRRPFKGPDCDLHDAARGWLALQGLCDPPVGLLAEHVFFETTKAAKLEQIRRSECTQFIDDLPEILNDPSFPVGVERILFDPGDLYAREPLKRAKSWREIEELLASC